MAFKTDMIFKRGDELQGNQVKAQCRVPRKEKLLVVDKVSSRGQSLRKI
jgi:hypothetical protein